MRVESTNGKCVGGLGEFDKVGVFVILSAGENIWSGTCEMD